MTYDTSSFRAFLRSLNLQHARVTVRPGRIVAGPPVQVFELALRLGLGPLVVNTPGNRALLRNLGVQPEALRVVSGRLRSRAQWRRAWQSLAEPHLAATDLALAAGDNLRALREASESLKYITVSNLGDGYYIRNPMRERRDAVRLNERLYRLLRELNDEPVERLAVSHPYGATHGLLHLPASGGGPYAALLALHPTGGDKDSYDFTLRPFREAGLATFCIDLPAHGENYDGPRIQPDTEVVALAALDVLAGHPAVDPARLAVMGGSLGAFVAQRAAAAAARVRACLAFASPFDIGQGLRDAVPGIQDSFSYVIGAPDLKTALLMAKPYHLRDTIARIKCPLALVHGTQDHICDFSVPFEIARRARCPLTIIPILGADHEVSVPGTEALAGGGIRWLKQILQ